MSSMPSKCLRETKIQNSGDLFTNFHSDSKICSNVKCVYW